ncbi:histidine phosphatase family protein [Cytobacillus solani]|uniref:histidine phosphatase family protein n=1 Tax=Cytobacillus solani TaxID=1637975 RepID=UPI00207A6C69|nr:histidine phosphatase family protein [Cytobacillus solani]USK52910.1 histidine phosphatase family protein [Cytobacillus solani]
MLTKLYFVRHAHSIYTADEWKRPLSDKGFLDADKVTKLLEAEKVDYVISSPYKRAIQTVEGIAKYIGKEIIIEDGFIERILSVEPVEDFDLAVQKVWHEPSFSWIGGESNQAAQTRGIHATFQILDRFEGNNIVIGTHGNIMVLIMNFFDGKYNFEFWKELSMPDIYTLEFDNGKLRDVKRLFDI